MSGPTIRHRILLPTVPRSPDPPQHLTHRHVRCDCGQVARYRADVTLITGAGSIIHGRLFLCESCYAEFVEGERPVRPAALPVPAAARPPR